MDELTTTSYSILALLAIRPWTTYELARQMDRSLRWYWPRAASVVYAEPKRLVSRGLAKAEKSSTGRRPRTIYSITPRGRRALRAWLDEPGAGPQLEFEALVKVGFADHGTTDQLARNLAAIRADADQRLREATDRLREYVETGGPFPQRLPVIALTGKLLAEHTALIARWAAWAEDQVATWDDAVGGPISPDALRLTWLAPTGRARPTPTGSNDTATPGGGHATGNSGGLRRRKGRR